MRMKEFSRRREREKDRKRDGLMSSGKESKIYFQELSL